MIRQLTKTQAEELKKTSAKKDSHNVGEIYPEIFDSDKGLVFGEGMKLDAAIIWLGAYELDSSEFPKIKCPVCGEEALIPYFLGASVLSGAHTIRFYCTKCQERIVFNDKIDYYHMIRDYIFKNQKTLKKSTKVKTFCKVSGKPIFIQNKNNV